MNLERKYNDILLSLEQEKEEKNRLFKDLENLKLHFSELEATNNHLIAATWRERDLKKKLSETIEELKTTRQIVESQNKRITESINYARKIQLAINPTEADLKNYYNDSFIFYSPKDVISGDFPWIFNTDDYLYVAAVDCTGHGVPGAMMSMIGNLLLNDIVNDGNILLPSQILRKLHLSVVQTLKQNFSDSNSNDGMDMGLCRIDKKNKQIIFSGAHRPLFFLRNGVVTIYSGNKFPIGGMHYKGMNNFSDEHIDFTNGDTIFLFTDGLPDQIGGEEKRKLMTKTIKTFLEEVSTDDMQTIKEKSINYYQSWKGNHKQIDDVLLMGIRF